MFSCLEFNPPPNFHERIRRYSEPIDCMGGVSGHKGKYLTLIDRPALGRLAAVADLDGTQPIFPQSVDRENSRSTSTTDVRMCRRPALFHHAALATFSGPACSIARM
jgi:hypothetical protein